MFVSGYFRKIELSKWEYRRKHMDEHLQSELKLASIGTSDRVLMRQKPKEIAFVCL
jgi:hypothetical protein